MDFWCSVNEVVVSKILEQGEKQSSAKGGRRGASTSRKKNIDASPPPIIIDAPKGIHVYKFTHI